MTISYKMGSLSVERPSQVTLGGVTLLIFPLKND